MDEHDIGLETARRLEIAREVAAASESRLREAFLAAAVYGSVAHGVAGPESDIEMTVITDESLPAHEEHFFARGVMVEVSRVPLGQMLRAARRVRWYWAIEVDSYRHNVVLRGDSSVFEEVRDAASDFSQDEVRTAEREGWWRACEIRGKVRSALMKGDRPAAVYLAWEFAYVTALRIGLHEIEPYESGRTLWSDVQQRGHGMAGLIGALTSGLVEIGPHVEAVWSVTKGWGEPSPS